MTGMNIQGERRDSDHRKAEHGVAGVDLFDASHLFFA